MKAIVRRLLNLAVLATPQLNDRVETLGDVIRARRERMSEESGMTFEDWPHASFTGTRSIGEIILHSRQLYRESTRPGSRAGGVRMPTDIASYRFARLGTTGALATFCWPIFPESAPPDALAE